MTKQTPSMNHKVFSDPTSALDKQGHKYDLSAYLTEDHGYYRPPIDLTGLAMLRRVNPQHGALPAFKANWLCKHMKPNALISQQTLKKVVIDHETGGNGYFQLIKNSRQVILQVKHLPMINTRRMKAEGQYCWLLTESQRQEGKGDKEYIKFLPNEVVHLMEYDALQTIYGVPYWIGAMQSILLGEDVRLFPRRFFKNGAHAGNWIITSGLTPLEEEKLNNSMGGTKGTGQFKSAVTNFPKGEVDKVVKVINFGEGASKIDYTKLADMCATDVLEAWRIRPELAGMMPENTQASGDLDKIISMYHENEIVPLMQHIQQINEFLPRKHWLEFEPFKEKQPIK